MTPTHTNTQDLSYFPEKHPNLYSLTPTELHILHSGMNKCHLQMAFLMKVFLETCEIYPKMTIDTY
jgi:hypothetical protein